MNNYIIIKTNDGILKFEGDLINCDIDNTSETTTAYDINKTELITFAVNKSIKIEAELAPTTDSEISDISFNNIQDVFAENRQLREVNAQLRALLESQEK